MTFLPMNIEVAETADAVPQRAAVVISQQARLAAGARGRRLLNGDESIPACRIRRERARLVADEAAAAELALESGIFAVCARSLRLKRTLSAHRSH
jgi:hypothetical protein